MRNVEKTVALPQGGAMAPCVQGQPCCWHTGAPSAGANLTRVKTTCNQTGSGPFPARSPSPSPPPPPSPPSPPSPAPGPGPPPPPPRVPGYDWAPPTDLWVNDFAGEEEDCLNQIAKVVAVNWTDPSGAINASFAPIYAENDHFAKTVSGQTPGKLKVVAVNWTDSSGGAMLALLYNAVPDYQKGNAFYNKHQVRTRDNDDAIFAIDVGFPDEKAQSFAKTGSGRVRHTGTLKRLDIAWRHTRLGQAASSSRMWPQHSPPVRQRAFFEFSLCLSRACLGKKMTVINKWLKKPVFPTGAESLCRITPPCVAYLRKRRMRRGSFAKTGWGQT